jgi:hypothetical protein
LGLRLRILIRNDQADGLDKVRRCLEQARLEARAEQVSPDIEDVFVAVTELRQEQES